MQAVVEIPAPVWQLVQVALVAAIAWILKSIDTSIKELRKDQSATNQALTQLDRRVIVIETRMGVLKEFDDGNGV